MSSFHPRPAIRGAVYIPARAFNAAQMWRHYDGAEVRRDLGYARTVHLNALRVWVSYEHWRMEPDRFARAFEDFLAAAAERGLGVLPSLFENCGVPPTEANLWNADLRTAMCVQSPDRDEVMRRPERWGAPGEFVDWFMGRHGDDARLVGVEVVNEPGPATAAFARAMFRRAAARRGRVPLTIGSVSLPDNAWFLDLGMDTLQYHDNFPPSVEDLRRGLDRAVELAGIVEKPVWLTEVQRVRTVSGWGDQPVPAAELGPDLASVLPAVREYAVGWFFWSLMLKPAYLPPQRAKGTINGLFHEDGAVWSLADARAVAGDPSFAAPERRERPAWMRGAGA
jgi:hypothetical protein